MLSLQELCGKVVKDNFIDILYYSRFRTDKEARLLFNKTYERFKIHVLYNNNGFFINPVLYDIINLSDEEIEMNEESMNLYYSNEKDIQRDFDYQYDERIKYLKKESQKMMMYHPFIKRHSQFFISHLKDIYISKHQVYLSSNYI